MNSTSPLLNILRAEIEKKSRLTFAEYMHIALYTPGLGYYSNARTPFGKSGDFITAPELSPPLFAQTLARYINGVLENLGGGDILELGPGSGALAEHLSAALQTHRTPPKNYFLLDASATLRERQKERLAQLKTTHFSYVEKLPENFKGVVIANEVLDALPVHRVSLELEGVYEYFVTLKDHELTWEKSEPHSNSFKIQLEKLRDRLFFSESSEKPNTPYITEYSLLIPDFIQKISNSLTQGEIIFIDYGFLENAYYHPQRSMGTLMCHHQHHAHDDLLREPGLHDITAHVNFSQVGESAQACGLEIIDYQTQAQFLMQQGLAETAQNFSNLSTNAQWQMAQTIKRLTFPSEMGELFKVMILSRNLL